MKRLNEMKYYLLISESVKKMILKEGFDDKYGARPIKRAIQEKIEDFISEEVLRKNIQLETEYILDLVDEKITLIQGGK